MAVFLNQERTKIGTTTGTIIAFPVELDVNDPLIGLSKSLLPAGYVRCDGSVYNEALYPALAEILGTGSTCSFKKPDQDLLDTQFQVPDLRSKFIKPSTGSDQGVINDATVINSADQTVAKSGVGVEVSSNVGTTAVVELTGQFRVPARTVKVGNNVGFTYPTKPDEEVVAANGFLPHAHYTTTYRCRTIRRAGSDIFELNYFTNASTIGVQNWYDATDEQPACLFYAQSEVWNGGSYISSGQFLGTGATFEYYGICKGSCSTYDGSCLVPQGNTLQLNTTPEGPCFQTYTIAAVGLLTVEMICASQTYGFSANYIQGGDFVGTDNIPTTQGSSGGAIQGFALYENLNVTADNYTKGIGQWAYTTYDGNLWSSLESFVTGEVDLVGGSGSGARASIRFEAWPDSVGEPNYTRYKILSWIDTGSGYAAGDTLTFPNTQGYALSGGPFQLEVLSTTFGDPAEAAGYSHNQSLHNVLPFDTVVDDSAQQAFPQLSNTIESTEAFGYEEDPTQHTHTIPYVFGATNFDLNIPELFVPTDGMEASINISPENVSKIDSLIAPFTMVEFLIKV